MYKRILLLFLLLGVWSSTIGGEHDLFSDLYTVYELVKKYYFRADNISETSLVHGAIRGLVDSLGDPYSVYLSPEDVQKWEEAISGKYVGIGIEVTIKDGWLTVVTPFPGTPAEKAGIRPGDVILAVDGESTEGWTLEQAAVKIRGPEGTTVLLKVKHKDGTIEDLEIVRRKIAIKSVDVSWLEEERVIYIKLSSFDLDTPRLFDRALSSVPLESAKGFILDLRNNPGGLLSSAIEIASRFVDAGVLAWVRTTGTRERRYRSRGNNLPNLPLAVLVNEGTASASELVAGAIQDHGVGILIGTPTFGKGVIQEIVMRFPDGGLLKLTTGEYLTPNKRHVHGKGLIPDIMVNNDKGAKGTVDPYLEAALVWVKEQQKFNLFLLSCKHRLREVKIQYG